MDLDEVLTMAHQDRHCMQILLFASLAVKELRH